MSSLQRSRARWAVPQNDTQDRPLTVLGCLVRAELSGTCLECHTSPSPSKEDVDDVSPTAATVRALNGSGRSPSKSVDFVGDCSGDDKSGLGLRVPISTLAARLVPRRWKRCVLSTGEKNGDGERELVAVCRVPFPA